MSAALNLCQFIGRLGRDPEPSVTPAGTPVLRFSVAVDEVRGEARHTEWVNVAAFGKTADALRTFLAKGMLVYVQGRMRTEERRTEIQADRVQVLTPKASTSEAPSRVPETTGPQRALDALERLERDGE